MVILNEEQLVLALKKGDKNSFSKLVDDYKNRIYSMAYKFTNDYGDAQDLAQEIFIKIYRQIRGFQGNSQLSTWIYRVGMNTCIDWKRKRDSFKETNLTALCETKLSYMARNNISSDKSPESKAIYDEEQAELHRIIYDLPEIYKTVVIMYHFNNMSYEEIGQALDIPIKTVETRLYRARKMLKTKLFRQTAFDAEVMGNEL